MSSLPDLLPLESITHRIVLLRGQKVLLDADLAALYGVETRRLNEQVRRNPERFPKDFIFEVNAAEFANLKSHFATSSWGGRRKLPLAFTEHGAIMAATVLSSASAAQVSVYVVRAFVQLREVLASNQDLARKLAELERTTEELSLRQDEFALKTRLQLKQAFEAIRQLMETPETSKKRPIGFVTLEERPSKPKTREASKV